MFDFVQKHRLVLQVFLALIAITFATWGIESYTRYAGGRDTVASVNGMDISRREFDDQVRQQQESVQRMFGGRIDPAAFDNPETRRAVLDQIEAEQREGSQSTIAAKQFIGQVKLDDAKLKEYYDSHLADFRTPERVRAEYVVLSADNLARQEPVTDEELKQAYDARASAFRVEEQRRASHILVKTKEEGSEEGRAGEGRSAQDGEQRVGGRDT